jgi:hypothetical protein
MGGDPGGIRDATLGAPVAPLSEVPRCCCGISVTGRPYSLQHRKAGGLGGSSENPLNFVTLCG